MAINYTILAITSGGKRVNVKVEITNGEITVTPSFTFELEGKNITQLDDELKAQVQAVADSYTGTGPLLAQLQTFVGNTYVLKP